MSMTIYSLRGETYTTNTKSRTAYGIAELTDDTDCVLQEIGDITEDQDALQALIDRCNRLALAPIHLCDVVEDFLCECFTLSKPNEF